MHRHQIAGPVIAVFGENLGITLFRIVIAVKGVWSFDDQFADFAFWQFAVFFRVVDFHLIARRQGCANGCVAGFLRVGFAAKGADPFGHAENMYAGNTQHLFRLPCGIGTDHHARTA